jgi:hypothetical protein
MTRQSKPRKPYKATADDEIVERLVPMPGWVYNLMAGRAAAQKRTTKYQISYELERLANKIKDQGIKDEEPGPKSAASMTA